MKNIPQIAGLLLRYLTILFLLINADGVVQGQKLRNKLPSVYISFKEYFNDDEGKEMVRLVLRNNTKWPIILTQPMGPALKGDFLIAPIIELATGCRDERLYIDVVRQIKLRSGKSVSFAVPSIAWFFTHNSFANLQAMGIAGEAVKAECKFGG